jgi:hypothetical protein
MREDNRTIFSLFLVVCSLVGCGRLLPIPDGPGRRVTEIPAQSELLGTWRLTDESITRLKREGFQGELSRRSHAISLFAGGKCDVRAYDGYDVNSAPSYISASGTWSIEVKRTVVNYVVLTIQWGDRSLNTNWGVFDMRLAKDGGKLVFWSFMTDPDERIYYEFAKDSTK